MNFNFSIEMSTETNPSGDTLFNTPNPTELKKAAKEDPIHERESTHEADVVDQHPNDQKLGQERDPDVGDEQIIKANISGH
jgi:hypothetical protein